MKLTRRDFLKTSAFLGGTVALAGSIDLVFSRLARAQGPTHLAAGEYARNKPENIIYSVCLNCHIRCSIKAKLVDGIVVKVDGSPFHATNRLPNLPYDTPLDVAAKKEGKLCPKGQAGPQITYDPYRVRKVLKRKPGTPRGGGEWITIDFNQAVEEIVNGGDLFGEGPVPGLKDIWKLRDPELSKVLAADSQAVARGEMSLEAFKQKHTAHLDLLIDPDHPDLGPVNNQFVFMAGRIQHGRKEFGKRFTYESFGSVNFFEHTTICEQSHHIATKLMTGGKKDHLKPDFLNSEFVIFWGTGAFEANFGVTGMAQLVTDAMTHGRLHNIAVVDPRLSKTAAKARWWVPVKPGGDTALAMGMIRWIIEHERYDRVFLENPNALAAANDGEKSWTDATFLVRQDNGRFLRVADLAGKVAPAPLPEVPPAEVAHPPHPTEDFGIPDFTPGNTDYVVMTEAGPLAASNAPGALLEFAGQVAGIPVKTVFTLLKERALEKSLEEYAQIAGVPMRTIVELADEFTSHGKKAAIDSYRGPVQHTDGHYAQQAILSLNWLIGNMDWKGGLSQDGGRWHELGEKGGPFPPEVTKSAPGGLRSFGLRLTREGSFYEESTLFQRDGGYPAKRPWYPFTDNVYHEVIPSAEDGYPYPIKVLLIHMGTPALASPAGHDNIRILRDPKKIPLVIACDVVVGETSMYADYIIPDLTYLERWGTPHAIPQPAVAASPVRQPAAAPVTELVTVDGEEMPISLEAFLIAVGKKLGLPGIGKGGFGKYGDLDRPEDFYLRLAANLAFGDKEDGSDAVPEAGDEELALFRQARRHLPPAVFDEAKWRRAVGDDESLWRRVVYLLNRGGRFEHFSQAYDGPYMRHAFKSQLYFYIESVGQAKHSLTGENFDPLPRVQPALDAAGKEIPDDESEYPFQLITFKEIYGGQSRTIGTYWNMSQLLPENRVLINRQDAERLGIADGDRVRLISASNPAGAADLGNGRRSEVVGRAQVVEGIRPGVVAASWHYGHWAYGAREIVVDGIVVPGDPRRGTGLCPNPVMRLDPALGNVCLTDPIGGSASFYDTRVKIVKA